MKNKVKTTFIVTTLAMGLLHLINHFISAAATVNNLLKPRAGKHFDWRFGNIYYTKTGSGSPLLLIHDLAPYSSAYEWHEVIRKFSKDHTVYAIDLIGCGRSDKPNMTYTNFLYVQLVSDFVKQVIGQKTDVAATGISSSFVVMACHNDPALFNRIVMINPESLMKLSSIPGKRSKVTKFILDMPIIGTAVYNIIVNRSNIEYSFTEKYLYNPFRLQQRYIDAYHEAAHLGKSGGKYLLSSLNGFYVNANISHALKEINNSIFIINGKKRDDSIAVTESYLAVNPSIEADYINDAKMLPQLETPDELYQHMSLFL